MPSTSKILRGENVVFKDHYKEILKYYDIIPVPRSFIEGAQLPASQGLFFQVKPEDNEAAFWANKAQQNPTMSGFINKYNNNNT